ncbi:hypothetical protein SZ64_04255 [Erythrobacter sp. SG61-1L]|uniref:hypothetical protein n=1 Tax=Erythrobacter sp. SG61-1L TaxID=1603897 RepID=UPI0006C8EB0F|nr:hypothetical protein [Erythrobacter sp. SG61-1L]KPL67384.1 hypothetical protein SZ64_04255 [Erythrobacter sp. SG61-1L]
MTTAEAHAIRDRAQALPGLNIAAARNAWRELLEDIRGLNDGPHPEAIRLHMLKAICDGAGIAGAKDAARQFAGLVAA